MSTKIYILRRAPEGDLMQSLNILKTSHHNINSNTIKINSHINNNLSSKTLIKTITNNQTSRNYSISSTKKKRSNSSSKRRNKRRENIIRSSLFQLEHRKRVKNKIIKMGRMQPGMNTSTIMDQQEGHRISIHLPTI